MKMEEDQKKLKNLQAEALRSLSTNPKRKKNNFIPSKIHNYDATTTARFMGDGGIITVPKYRDSGGTGVHKRAFKV